MTLIFSVAVLVLVWAGTATAQSTWTQGYHDALNSGQSDVAISTNPTLKWSKTGTGMGSPCADEGVTIHPDSGAAITADALYTSADKKPGAGDARSVFYRLNLSTGACIWSYDTGVDGAKHDGLVTIDAVNNTAIWPAHDGLLRANDLTTGALTWRYTFTGQPEGGPTLAGGVLYYLAQAGLYALDPANLTTCTGNPCPTVLWNVARAQPPHGVAGKPAVNAGVVYWGGWQEIYATNATTGATIWSRCPSGCTITDSSLTDWTFGFSAIHYYNGVVYANAGYTLDTTPQTRLSAYNATTGAEVWTPRVTAVDFQVKNVLSVEQGLLIGGWGNNTAGGGVIAHRLSDGTEAWRQTWPATRFTNGAPALSANNRVIALQSDGTVHMLDAATGADLWSFTSPDTMHGASEIGLIAGTAGFAVPDNGTFRVYTATVPATLSGKITLSGKVAVQ